MPLLLPPPPPDAAVLLATPVVAIAGGSPTGEASGVSTHSSGGSGYPAHGCKRVDL